MDCKGCVTRREIEFYEINKCVILNCSPKSDCPCQECMIKVICSKQCEAFVDLFYSIFKMPPSYDYKCVNHDNPIIYYPFPRRPAWYKRL